MARRLGIAYLIWNNQTWRAYDPGRGWTEYNGCLAPKKQKKKFDNFCHRTHVHLSFTWDGASSARPTTRASWPARRPRRSPR